MDVSELNWKKVMVEEPKPGVIMSTEKWALALQQACCVYGLEQQKVLSNPYGYTPMPKPPESNPDGTGKVWPDISVDVAVHPVFWLDKATRERKPDEPDDEYSVRLYVELMMRNLVKPEGQTVISPFALKGIDDTDEDVVADLERYIKGESVEWLNQFEVGPPPEHNKDFIESRVDILLKRHRKNHKLFAEAMAYRAGEAKRHAMKTIAESNFAKLAQPIVPAGRELLASPDDQTKVEALKKAVENILQAIDNLDECRGNLELSYEKAQGKQPSSINVGHQLDIQKEQRHKKVSNELLYLYKNPSKEQLSSLWKTLSLMHKDISNRGKNLIVDIKSIERET